MARVLLAVDFYLLCLGFIEWLSGKALLSKNVPR